jgi:hypothetical protein
MGAIASFSLKNKQLIVVMIIFWLRYAMVFEKPSSAQVYRVAFLKPLLNK